MAKPNKYRNNIQKQEKGPLPETSLVPKNRKSPLLAIMVKALVMTGFVAASIFYLESKGYFEPDETNNHTKRKWDSLYKLSKRHNMDILLLGNSHLYTGINPHNLTSALGANAFILASPGTYISDSYFSLKEALKITKPKIVVLETYGIADYDPYNLSESALSDQFKSFSARRDFFLKMESLPYLFTSDNYFYAWFNSIRNHDFIFKNKEQIEKNIALKKKPLNKRDAVKAYLGRFVLFTTGLQDSTLAHYKAYGATVDGNKWKSSHYNDKYLKKISDLCNENGIELVFLTLPMYYEHVKNYQAWKENLGKIISKYSDKWLDLQDPYDFTVFGPHCFENTYGENQHLTYQGSLIATYKLEEYIRNNSIAQLPNRKNEQHWLEAFYGEEGYFENNPPLANDMVNKVLAKDVNIENHRIKEVDLVFRAPNKSVIAKVEKPATGSASNFNGKILRLLVRLKNNQVSYLDLNYSPFHRTASHAVFMESFTAIDDFEVLNGAIVEMGVQ